MSNTASLAQHNYTLDREIINLYASINEATYRLLKLIGEFDRAHLGFERGYLSTAHWLSYHLGLGGNAAREKVRVARALENLNLIDAAYATGKLSYSKVRALTRAATPDNEARLLDMAQNASAQQLERIVADQLRIQRGQAEVSCKPELTMLTNSNGEWVVKGRLPNELGKLLKHALDHVLEQHANDATAAEQPAISERRAYALLELAENAMDKTNPTSSADRYLVHIDADDPTLSQSARERLCCDASTVVHQQNEHGEVLNVGRRTRTIPPAIRRALRKRDCGCRFPGCTHTRYVDAHHIQHWAHGGETKLSNLITLCRRHHTLVHEREVYIQVHRPAVGAQQFRFIDRSGKTLSPAGHEGLIDPIPLPVAQDVTAVTPGVGTPKAPWSPDHYTRRPDYGLIAELLGDTS